MIQIHKIAAIIFVLLWISNIGISQCPNIPGHAIIEECPTFDCDICPSQSLTLNVEDENLQNGWFRWYISDTPNFDPNVEGLNFMSGTISNGAEPCNACPKIEAIYIDACTTPESAGEFMVISSGSGFEVDDLSLNYDMDNSQFGTTNDDVNLGGSACNWQDGFIVDFSGCSDFVAAGPGDYIPPNSIVILQSSAANNFTYDVSSLCGLSDCIFVISSTCSRNGGAYSNCDTNGDKTSEISLSCGCSDQITHSGDDPGCINSNSTYLTDEGVYGNNGCPFGPDIVFDPVPLSSAGPMSISNPFNSYPCNTTQYIVGVFEPDYANQECCGDLMTPHYAFNLVCATAEIDQTGNGDLCYGDCSTIKFNFTGGVEPYNLNLEFVINGLGITFPFSVPGFAANDGIEVCYDGTGILPSFDSGSQTLHIPELAAGFSGEFILASFTNADGCNGDVTGSGFALSFLETPEAFEASLSACDEGGGFGTFDLSEADNTVNGGSGETVNYYGDPLLNFPLFSPYVSTSSIIYATVSNDDCTSPPVEVELIVSENGDAGLVELSCDANFNTDCSICDADGTLGEDVTLYFTFDQAGVDYDVIMNYGPNIYMNTFTGPTGTETFNITETTTFQIVLVTAEGDCADATDLGSPVTITYDIQPDVDPIGPLVACNEVTLPAITGTGLDGTELYYTGTNQTGDSYSEGAIITTSTTLYVYSGIAECFDEEEVIIEITPDITYDQPIDTISCGPYTLPEITGQNVPANNTVAYYTLPDGNGNIYMVGNQVLNDETLYIYDPNSTCIANQPSFTVTIENPPILTEIGEITTCGSYELPDITGTFLSGNQSYYTEMGGEGTQYPEGSTVTDSIILYAYDDNNGCTDEIEVIINIGGGPTAGVGDTIAICKIDTLTVSLPDLLISPADTLGMWSDDMGIIDDDTDSTMVDLDNFSGVVKFMYVILNDQCENDTSHLQLTIVDQPNAGVDSTIIDCAMGNLGLLNFYDILSISSSTADGQFNDLDNSMLDLTDPTAVDISTLDEGIYNILHFIAVDTICTSDTAIITLNITPEQSAGDPVMVSACKGSVVDLTTVLTNNTSVGTFSDPSGMGALTGSSVDTDLLSPGTYMYTHSIMTVQPCSVGPVSTTIQLTVTNDVTAGENANVEICAPGMIELTQYLDGASAGGVFIDENSDTIPNNTFVVSASGVYNIRYRIGDDIDCPLDEATITINVLEEPDFTFSIDEDIICLENNFNFTFQYDYIAPFTYQIWIQDSTDFSIEAPSHTLEYTISQLDPSTGSVSHEYLATNNALADYSFDGDQWYYLRMAYITKDGCFYEYEDYDSIYIRGLDTLIIDDVLCEDDSMIVNGSNYTINNSTGIEIIPRPGECDSIVLVDLEFLEHQDTMIILELCTGESIEVNGVTFDESMPQADITFQGGASNGCDSIIIVDLTFTPAKVANFFLNICPGDEEIFNGIIYDQDNLIGTDTLYGGSVIGCDSIINVNLTLNSQGVNNLDEVTCDNNFEIIVNGNTYDLDNPSGTELISQGSTNGCDSIVNINITYLDNGNAVENGTICPGESIIVNGNIYDENNLTGTEVISAGSVNGCDSTITVDLQLLTISEGDFVNASCDDNYSVMINGTLYDVNNPTGMELLTAASANGCDSLVNVELTFDGLIIESNISQPSCAGDDMGIVEIINIMGTAPYYYNDNGSLIEISDLPTSINVGLGSGEILLEDINGCQSFISYNIMAAPEPQASYTVVDNVITISGLENIDIQNISWSPSTGLSCDDCLVATYVTDVDQEYNVMITYGDNCVLEIAIPVEADPIKIFPVFDVPNIFSPNGDGNNEEFFLTSSDPEAIVIQMSIYDRWGNQVYSRENYRADLLEGWNGRFKGKDVNPGVFVYYIEILSEGKVTPLFGDVTIIR